MTRTAVCQLLGVSPKSLYLWERDGLIAAPKRDRRGWRTYGPKDVAALRKFLGAEAAGDSAAEPPRRPRGGLEGLSARNQIHGEVVAVRGDGVLCEIVLRLGDGQEITSVITRRSADRLGLKRGVEATAVIKSTEVMLFR
jgi:molybdopterin-binding protein